MVEELVKTDINIDFKLDEKLSPIYNTDVNGDVQIVLFKVNYEGFEKAYLQKVCGKTCYEYVKKVCSNFKTIETEINSTDDPVFYAKSLINKDYKFTALLFCDTPLLTSSTFLGALDYARLKNVNMLRLYRGFIFNTEYLNTISNLYLKEPMDYESQDFIVCKNYRTLHQINNLMQERIYNYHFENGVTIVGNPIINADAIISRGSKIIGSSQILCSSQIAQNSIINNSIINNTIVGENCFIENSVITDSIVKNNAKVEPFCNIQNKSIICENVCVKSGSYINNQKIEK